MNCSLFSLSLRNSKKGLKNWLQNIVIRNGYFWKKKTKTYSLPVTGSANGLRKCYNGAIRDIIIK